MAAKAAETQHAAKQHLQQQSNQKKKLPKHLAAKPAENQQQNKISFITFIKLSSTHN